MRVGLPGLEPGTSSLSEKHHALQEVSRVCKMPANLDIPCAKLFPSFQIIRLGCCTVAAHERRWERSLASFSLRGGLTRIRPFSKEVPPSSLRSARAQERLRLWFPDAGMLYSVSSFSHVLNAVGRTGLGSFGALLRVATCREAREGSYTQSVV